MQRTPITPSDVGAPYPGVAERVSPLLEVWRSHIGQSPCHVRSSANEIRRNIFDWDRLNHILTYHRLDFPRLRIVHREQGARDIDITRTTTSLRGRVMSRLDTALMYQQLNEGGTLSLSYVSKIDPGLRDIRVSLESVLNLRLNINLYASSKPQRGLGLHWDAHDVLVVQVAGHKSWTVYEPTRRYPLFRDIEPNAYTPDKVRLETLMQPGDMLYVPRGWWHDVVAVDEPSLHLTIGFASSTGADYLYWLVGQMLDYELMRRDIPNDADAQANMLITMREALIAEFDSPSRTIEAFERDTSAAVRVPPVSSLPFGIDGVPIPQSGTIFSNCVNTVSITTLSEHVICHVDDCSITMPLRCEAILRHILKSVETLEIEKVHHAHARQLSTAEIDDLLNRLTTLGLIGIAS